MNTTPITTTKMGEVKSPAFTPACLQIASSTAAAFFSAELFGDPQALSYLAKPQDGVSVEVRE